MGCGGSLQVHGCAQPPGRLRKPPEPAPPGGTGNPPARQGCRRSGRGPEPSHYPRLGDGASRLIGLGSAACGDRQGSNSVMNSNYLLIVANSSSGDTL